MLHDSFRSRRQRQFEWGPTTSVAMHGREQFSSEKLEVLTWGRVNLSVKPERLKSALFVEGSYNMYMPTPGLGIDKVAQTYRDNIPDSDVHTLIIGYKDRVTPCSFSLHKNGQLVKSDDFHNIHDILCKLDPGLIGIGGTSKEFSIVVNMLNSVGYDFSQTLRVGGGIHASTSAKEVMQYFAGRGLDLCFTGRADENFSLFLRLLQNECTQELFKVPGTLAYVRSSDYPAGFVLTPSTTGDSLVPKLRIRSSSKNPLMSKFPKSRDLRQTEWGDELVLRIQTAEGCQYSCSFCAVSSLTLADPNLASQRWRPYNLDGFASYLDSISNDIRVNESKRKTLVYLEDAQIGGRPGSDEDLRAKQLLALTAKYPYRFGIQIRYDTFLENKNGERVLREDFLDLLKTGNIRYLFLSVESINPNDLRRMDKGQTGNLEEIYAVYKALKDRGIDYMISFIGGMEGQATESVLQTAAFIVGLDPKHIAFEIAKVYPGTKDAIAYQDSHGINVAEAYTSGNHLQSYRGRLGVEEQGCLLQSLSTSSAIRISTLVQDMICGPKGSIRNKLESQFPALGKGEYKELSPGFYSRTTSDLPQPEH